MRAKPAKKANNVFAPGFLEGYFLALFFCARLQPVLPFFFFLLIYVIYKFFFLQAFLFPFCFSSKSNIHAFFSFVPIQAIYRLHLAFQVCRQYVIAYNRLYCVGTVYVCMQYIFVRTLFSCVVVTLRRGALLFIAAVFHHCRLSSLPPGSILCPLAFLSLHTFTDVCVYLLSGPFAGPLSGTFCRTFVLKRLQRSFHTVLRRFLSGLIVCRIHLHRLHRFARLCGLICGKFAVLGVGVGLPPKGRRREAQLRSHRILKFPKKFFLKNLLPPTLCLPKIFSGKFPLSVCVMPPISMPKTRFPGSVPCMRTQETS